MERFLRVKLMSSETDITQAKKGRCCAPSSVRQDLSSIKFNAQRIAVRSPPDYRVLERMIPLPGGTFLMGTDYAEAFPQDGEGPVRAVNLVFESTNTRSPTISFDNL
jgi:hypothetical protein